MPEAVDVGPSFASRAMRFLAVGASNTVLTYLLMLALTMFVSHAAAYSVAFAAGVAYNALLSGPVVFAVRPEARRVALYTLWLLAVYGAGLASLEVAVRAGLTGTALVMAFPLLVTAPLSFLGASLLLARPNPTYGDEGVR